MNTSIVNKSIIIRKAKVSDAKAIATFKKQGLMSSNWKYLGTIKIKNLQKEIKYTQEGILSKHLFVYIAIDKKQNKIIGTCGGSYKPNKRYSHVLDLGWGVDKDYQGRGIGTGLLKSLIEFAKKKGFKRLEAQIADENKCSLALSKKCGFVIEGKKRKAFLTDDGRYIDLYVVGRLI